MGNIVLSEKNLELLNLISQLGFLTEKHICALFYTKHKSGDLDMVRARQSLSVRISEMANGGYLAKAAIPSQGLSNRVGYILGPAGALALKDTKALESMQDLRWLEIRRDEVLYYARHHLISINFLVNLMMLSRERNDLEIKTWLPDSDCRFYIPKGGKKLVLNPDLYLCITRESKESIPIFLEVDRNTNNKSRFHRKVLRFFLYYSSDKHIRDLNESYFPRVCILAPTEARLESLQSVVRESKRNYNGDNAEGVATMPFWFATFEGADVYSIEEGRVSDKPLNGCWFNERGKQVTSPLEE